MIPVALLYIFLSAHDFAHGKRGQKPIVKPVVQAGLQFEVVDGPQNANGGYVRVVNTRNNLPLCTKKIYETQYDPKLETDVQDNPITMLKIHGNELIIKSEKQAPVTKALVNFCD